MAVLQLPVRAAAGYADADVPWWAVALLDLPKKSPLCIARRIVEDGNRSVYELHPERQGWQESWAEVVDLARRTYGDSCIEEQVRADRAGVLAKLLWSPRAFLQAIDLRDDDDNPVILKDFHVNGIMSIRKTPVCEILWPYMHGKSANSSLTIPLMDWAENPESTQIRVFRTQEMGREATRKLMHEVENNAALHALCPWISRPEPGDINAGTWGVSGFSISDRKVVGFSFRPLTIGGTLTGLRADRVGVDDLVDDNNATSLPKQDKYFNQIKSGVLTTRRFRRDWTSKYETVWGSAFIVGTIYDKRDVNHRMYEEIRGRQKKGDRNYSATRVSVFPTRGSEERGEVIWPEHRPFEFVMAMKEQLGYRAFRMRMMNLPVDDGTEVFSAEAIEKAIDPDLRYGVRPPIGCRMIIGFDPAVGKRTKGSKFPAAVAVGYNAEVDHWWLIRYERWSVPMPEQVRRLHRWATEFSCPVVVEANAIQESYADWMEQLHASVEVRTFMTGATKHDLADGVESWQPLFNHNKVSICAGGVLPDVLSEFKQEWVGWPTGRYTDLLMAAWFAKYELDLMHRKPTAIQAHNRAPAYVRNRGLIRTFDLSRYSGR